MNIFWNYTLNKKMEHVFASLLIEVQHKAHELDMITHDLECP